MEKFCLKWQHFEDNLTHAFQELRSDQELFDVTLATGDGRQVEAHRVVLAACSGFFRHLLRHYRHPHPLVYLKGVKFSEILSVLNFMYHGEVSVAQDQLGSFLSVAEELQVKGLTTRDSSPGAAAPRQPEVQLPPLKRARASKDVSPASSQLPAEDAQGEEDADPAFLTPKPDPDLALERDSDSVIIPQPTSKMLKDDITEQEENKGAGTEHFLYLYLPHNHTCQMSHRYFNLYLFLGYEEIWSKLEKSGKIIRCRICGLNKHQDFFATLVNHIRKDHL